MGGGGAGSGTGDGDGKKRGVCALCVGVSGGGVVVKMGSSTCACMSSS